MISTKCSECGTAYSLPPKQAGKTADVLDLGCCRLELNGR